MAVVIPTVRARNRHPEVCDHGNFADKRFDAAVRSIPPWKILRPLDPDAGAEQQY